MKAAILLVVRKNLSFLFEAFCKFEVYESFSSLKKMVSALIVISLGDSIREKLHIAVRYLKERRFFL